MSDQRPPEVEALYRGAKRLAPGVYETAAGALLFNAAEVLAEVGLPDTAENRAIVLQALGERAGELAPGAGVVPLVPGGPLPPELQG